MLDIDKNSTTSQKPPKQKETTRRIEGSLDDRFIELYCDNPTRGKTQAIIDAGYVGPYAKQEGYRLYKKLHDRITKRTDDLINGLAELAASQLQAILQKDPEEVGYANMSKAIQQGLDYAGRKPGDKLTIVKEESIEDIEADLQQVNEELSKTPGIRTH